MLPENMISCLLNQVFHADGHLIFLVSPMLAELCWSLAMCEQQKFNETGTFDIISLMQTIVYIAFDYFQVNSTIKN